MASNLKLEVPRGITGEPFEGWKLQSIDEIHDPDFPDGWRVVLRRTQPRPPGSGHSRVAGYSYEGVYEAWDEACCAAQREVIEYG